MRQAWPDTVFLVPLRIKETSHLETKRSGILRRWNPNTERFPGVSVENIDLVPLVTQPARDGHLAAIGGKIHIQIWPGSLKGADGAAGEA